MNCPLSQSRYKYTSDRDVMSVMYDLWEKNLPEAEAESKQRCGGVSEQTVIVTAAVADPIARPIEGQAGHQYDIDVSKRHLWSVCARLAQAKTA